MAELVGLVAMVPCGRGRCRGRGGGGRQGGHGQMAMNHLHGVLCRGAVCRGGVVAWAWPRGHHLPVVVMSVWVGMQGLRVLRGNMEGGLLDWVCLSSDGLWSNATSPHQRGWVRLSCLSMSTKQQGSVHSFKKVVVLNKSCYLLLCNTVDKSVFFFFFANLESDN